MFCWPGCSYFLILISFLAIKIAFLPPLQRIGNFAGKAANSLELIIQSPTTLLHLISPASSSAPLWRRGTPLYYFLIWSPSMHCRCSSQLNPSPVNPAFHLAQRDLSAYGSLMISISCAVTNIATHTQAGYAVSFQPLPRFVTMWWSDTVTLACVVSGWYLRMKTLLKKASWLILQILFLLRKQLQVVFLGGIADLSLLGLFMFTNNSIFTILNIPWDLWHNMDFYFSWIFYFK